MAKGVQQCKPTPDVIDSEPQQPAFGILYCHFENAQRNEIIQFCFEVNFPLTVIQQGEWRPSYILFLF